MRAFRGPHSRGVLLTLIVATLLAGCAASEMGKCGRTARSSRWPKTCWVAVRNDPVAAAWWEDGFASPLAIYGAKGHAFVRGLARRRPTRRRSVPRSEGGFDGVLSASVRRTRPNWRGSGLLAAQVRLTAWAPPTPPGRTEIPPRWTPAVVNADQLVGHGGSGRLDGPRVTHDRGVRHAAHPGPDRTDHPAGDGQGGHGAAEAEGLEVADCPSGCGGVRRGA